MPAYNLIKEEIKSIAPYVPGKSIEEIAEGFGLDPSSIIKLGSNENPLGPSPKAVEALIAGANDISIYPSADARELVAALAFHTGLPEDNIVASGPGMDGLLDGLMRLLISCGDEVILPTPTFSYYEIAARASGARAVYVPRRDDFSLDMEAFHEAMSDRTKLIFLCSPNNPSGNVVPQKHLRELLETTSGLVFLDEAYVEFADSNCAGLLEEYDNLIIGRTFSKAFGLAGLRIGYGLMPQWLREEYMKVGTPFNVSTAAIAAAVAALTDEDHLEKSLRMVKEGKKYLQENLLFKTYDTRANFMLMDVKPFTAKEVCTQLLKEGIIVRDCTSFRDAGNSLVRMTIGTQTQNEKMVTLLNEISKNS